MREIKFRAWDKKSKSMRILSKLIFMFESITGIAAKVISDNPISSDYLCETCEFEDLIIPENLDLMQFTGLKDKNGKEIYEGDILKYYYKPLGCQFYDRWYNYERIYIDTIKGVGRQTVATGRYQVDLPDRLKGNKFADDIYHRVRKNENIIYSHIRLGGDRYEVIGNIYENPELLEAL